MTNYQQNRMTCTKSTLSGASSSTGIDRPKPALNFGRKKLIPLPLENLFLW